MHMLNRSEIKELRDIIVKQYKAATRVIVRYDIEDFPTFETEVLTKQYAKTPPVTQSSLVMSGEVTGQVMQLLQGLFLGAERFTLTFTAGELNRIVANVSYPDVTNHFILKVEDDEDRDRVKQTDNSEDGK